MPKMEVRSNSKPSLYGYIPYLEKEKGKEREKVTYHEHTSRVCCTESTFTCTVLVYTSLNLCTCITGTIKTSCCYTCTYCTCRGHYYAVGLPELKQIWVVTVANAYM